MLDNTHRGKEVKSKKEQLDAVGMQYWIQNRKPQWSYLSILDVVRHIQDRELTDAESQQVMDYVRCDYTL